MSYAKLVLLVPLVIVVAQLYYYATTRCREKKQACCSSLGITFFTSGIIGLVFRDALTVLGGFILLMLGLRLIAHGLDRLDKKVFIDRYDQGDL